MRKTLAALGLALATAGALTFPPAATPASAESALARGAVSVSLFYGELAPHGRWFRHPRWGWAWFPTAVDADWRPYSRGQWAWTDENGWYWISDEPFGWAVYHYGRWSYDEEYGWIWIPGTTWGPAWVAFRDSDEYVGWAPLPPETLDAGYDWAPGYTALDASYYQPRWLFIPRRHFLDRRAYAYAAPVQRNVVIIRGTRNVTRYERGRRGVFNRGFEPRRLEAAIGRRVTPLRVNVVTDPRRVGPDRAGRQVNVYRPAVRVSRDAAPPAAARARAQDRPRVRIQREAVAPSERRARTAPLPPLVTRPPAAAPRTVQPGDRRAPDPRREDRTDRDSRRAAPVPVPPPAARPPAARAPETVPPRIATPPGIAPPRATPPDQRRAREERRAVPPAVPGRVAPPQPQAPRVAAPPQPPRAPELRREQRAVPPSRPPANAAPPAPRSAPPSFSRPPSPPPRVVPSAPPTPRAQPPAPKPQPSASPRKRDEDRKGR